MDDHQFEEEETESVGELSTACSQIVLKSMYLARNGRPDILWSVNKLARAVTKRTKACDKRLTHLITYIHHTSEYRQYCYGGNTAQQCRLGLFQDSDFAGDLEDSKSTSGGVLCIFGSHTFMPTSWIPYERRFGKPFKGPIIPFGSLVEYHTISAKDQSRIHQFGQIFLPGWFLGYALCARWIWKGDILVADLEELETMDASEVYSKRLNAKEVIFPKENGKFIFPAAGGWIKLPGRDQELRTPILIREHPIRGESHVDFLGEWEGSLPPPQDLFPDAGEATNDFWSKSGNFIFRHHVEPGVKLDSPREESFPIPLRIFDVSGTTRTDLDVKQERRIDDYWNVDGSRDLSDSWTGFAQFTFLEEKPPDGYMWSGERLTRKQLTSRPDHSWPELWIKIGKKCQAGGEAKVVQWKTQ